MSLNQHNCVKHPDRHAYHNLDGDNLCLECANKWAHGERVAAAERNLNES